MIFNALQVNNNFFSIFFSFPESLSILLFTLFTELYRIESQQHTRKQ